MGFDDRLGWLLFGSFIGFVLGYIVRSLREIKEELDEVDQIVKRDLDGDQKNGQNGSRNEDGLMRRPLLLDIALLIVLLLTVWASFASQRASNEVQDTQDDLVQTQKDLADTQDDLADAQDFVARVSYCNQRFLAKTISALNERTEYTQRQANANVELQRAQAKFFGVILGDPPAPPAVRRAEGLTYFAALNKFVRLSGEQQNATQDNPYPTNEELNTCLSAGKKRGIE